MYWHNQQTLRRRDFLRSTAAAAASWPLGACKKGSDAPSAATGADASDELLIGGLPVTCNLTLPIACTMRAVAKEAKQTTGALFRYSKIGIAMQASSQNQLAAYLSGIRVKRVTSLVWAIAGAIAAVCGLLLAPIALYPDQLLMQMLMDQGRHAGQAFLQPATVALMASEQWRLDATRSNGSPDRDWACAWGLGVQRFTDRSGPGGRGGWDDRIPSAWKKTTYRLAILGVDERDKVGEEVRVA